MLMQVIHSGNRPAATSPWGLGSRTSICLCQTAVGHSTGGPSHLLHSRRVNANWGGLAAVQSPRSLRDLGREREV